jgi:DNA-binding transcriptional regulator YiaG
MSVMGANISQARRSAGMSIEDMARACGVECAQVRAWESGRQEPSSRTLALIGDVVEIMPSRLRGGGR